MKRIFLLTLLVTFVCSVGIAHGSLILSGQMKCTFSGCINDGSGDWTYMSESTLTDGYGAKQMCVSASMSPDQPCASPVTYLPVMWVDDTTPNQGTVIQDECDLWQTYGLDIRRVILAGIAPGGSTFYACDSTDTNDTQVINVQEDYPYWDFGSDGDENSGGTANDVEKQDSFTDPNEFTCKWGWLAQDQFGWPAGSITTYNNPHPTNQQYADEFAALITACPEDHVHTFGSDGATNTGFEGQY